MTQSRTQPVPTPLPKPELLAPAGTIAAGLTAFDCGADAIYAGLPRFNARERGDNCTADEMSRLIAYAHKNGRKVYVTLNTLLKETELAEAADIAAALADMAPDAIIVQDLGLIRMLRECFPTLALHGSTQMGLHNSAGAAFAKSAGLSRIILERQTTFEEILALRKNTDIELEMFVHGALCCGRSGSCLFSSFLGGWSGNRGKCKQPCRRRYFSERGNGFFFSPGDLCLLEYVPFLKKAGLASLKIEGRLRREDYVRSVVSAYRLMLDAEPANEVNALKEARSMLAMTTGRKWTPGFSKTESFETVLQHETLGASGLLCGRVTNLEHGRFTVELSRRLLIYERVRVQPESGDEGPVFTVTKMDVDGQSTYRAEKGQLCTIYCDKAVAHNALVYKVGISTPDLAPRVAKLPTARVAVDLEVAADAAGVTVTLAGGVLPPWTYPVAISEAQKHALAPETLETEFASTRSETLAAGRIKGHVTGRLFLPATTLKEIRRAFWEWLEAQPEREQLRPGRLGLARFDAMMESLSFPPSDGVVRTVQPPPGRPSSIKASRVARTLVEAAAGIACDEVVLPDFVPETELPKVRESIRQLLARGVKRFRVTSVYGFTLLEKAQGVKITTAFPLPACNSLAVRELLDRGARRVQAWIELDAHALEALMARARPALEVFIFGRPPMLTTRAVPAMMGEVTDGRGLNFEIVREEGVVRLYAQQAYRIPEPDQVDTFMDCARARPDESAASSFNYDQEWK
jgi:putative protease